MQKEVKAQLRPPRREQQGRRSLASRSWSWLAAILKGRILLPTTAAGERVYAVGDVHGRLDLFRQLLAQLEADAGSRKCPTRIVLLGDLIDRGPHSKQMLELARRMQLQNSDRIVVLCGNHEDMLLASADGNADAQHLWLRNGGDATLRSYGLEPSEFAQLTPHERGCTLRKAVGIDTLVWLGALPSAWRSGDYFFCHAGVRPGIPLERQRREDLLWIRREFLDSNRFHGAVIVHGHCETDNVKVLPNRINVDTGAYRSGELTAAGLQGRLSWFISTAQRCLYRSDLDEAIAADAKRAVR